MKMSLNFPRGGKKSNLKSQDAIFFKQSNTKTKKTRLKKSKENNSLLNKPNELSAASNLKYSTLYEGMVILGRVFRVTDYNMIISLPGQINGKLLATDISESYTKLLRKITNNKKIREDFKLLPDLYKEGDFLICYIKRISPNFKNIFLSLEPTLINQNLNLSFITKYSKVVLTVSSIEDHGYILETGLKNLRAFLSMKDTENKIKFYPGKQILCALKTITILDNVYTINVSVKLKYLNKLVTNIISHNNLIPGTKFFLSVQKILNNGLQVYFGEKNIGYINELYIQNKLSTFEKGQQLEGSLLYITNNMKFAYFSLISYEQESRLLSVGDIISKAKVLLNTTKGSLIELKNDAKGFIPLKYIEAESNKFSSALSTDFIHKCKIMAYDSISKLYICKMETKLTGDRFADNITLKPGDIVDVTVTNINEATGYITVLINNSIGIVPSDQISDPGLVNELKIGQIVKARVLESSEKIILTLKMSLINSKLPILHNIDDAKVHAIHDGSVIKLLDKGVLVRFYGNVKGWIPKKFLNPETISKKWNLLLGQTITVVIKNIDNNKITLALLNKKQNSKYTIGDIVEGVVTDSSVDGVYVRLGKDNKESIKAFLPAGHMSPCYEVGKLLAAKLVAGDTLSAIIFSVNPNIILSTIFFPETIYKINDLNFEDIMLCSIKKIDKQSIKVLLPIMQYSKYGIVSSNNAGNINFLYENQILYGRVIAIDKRNQEINLSFELSKVWKNTAQHDVKMTAIDILSFYLNKISELSKTVYYSSKPISKITIGQRIKGFVENLTTDGLILKLDKNLKGIVRSYNYLGNYNIGDKIEGSVLWINYPCEFIEITLLSNIMNSINLKQNRIAKLPIGVQLRGEIVLVTNWLILVVLKGQSKGTIVALPSRRHLNDIVPDLTPYQIGSKVRCYSVLNKEDADILLPICMLKSAFEKYNSKGKTSINFPHLKRKQENIDNQKLHIAKKIKKSSDKENTFKEEIEANEYYNFTSNLIKMYENSEKNNKLENKTIKKRNMNLSISECGFKWNNLKSVQSIDKDSSESEEIKEFIKHKKKILNSAEQRELDRQKESVIRAREEALNYSQLPQTVDQLDRLILSNSNSSLLWMQYIAYHLQFGEIDKARAVVRRALTTINFREENEKLNIWKAWLNLESRFGTVESLNEVFQEAVKNNDAEKIYVCMLNIYIDGGRQLDLDKFINTMLFKYKYNPETWINCGRALLKIGMKDKSRHIMHRALQSLPKNEHVQLMIRFAQLENKFGNKEHAQTLYEQILSLYPKRIDVWTSFFDSLTKTGNFEIARKILDRAMLQNFPLKKMKTLFTKYINFEEKFGSPENVSRIKELAVKYAEEKYNIHSREITE